MKISADRFALKTAKGFVQEGQLSYASFGTLEEAKLYKTDKAAKAASRLLVGHGAVEIVPLRLTLEVR